ncbi:MAG: PAS domain-containing protein [Opitutales bacterium]|nr:PAS domain-containing protein [Opitutales bacterium]
MMLPRKLLLLSPDPEEELILNQYIQDAKIDNYTLQRISHLHKLKEFELSTMCDAVLLDMQIERSDVIKAIEYLASKKGPVALICLCRNHKQLRDYIDVIHLIDDYILAESLTEGELPTRISHAIRRCQTEFQLLSEQNLLKALLDNIPDAIYFKDRNSRFLKVNSAMAKQYGHNKPHELIGKSDFDLFTKEHAQPAYDDEQCIIQTGDPLIGKIEKETLPNGKINWVTTTKLPLRNEHDEIIGTMGISRTVTELKETQEALSRESALLKTIIDHALAGIYVKDREGRYLIVNKRHATYLGAPNPAAVRNKQLFDFFPHEEASRINALDETIMEKDQGMENMIDERRIKDGKTIWLLTSKVPFHDESGNCIGLVGISQDITLQKNIELQLKSTIQTLEETKLQLIEAEKLKTVGRLAAGIAHEVKNPLAVVLLGVDFLKSQLADNTELREMLEDMHQAVNKANDVVFELLDYSSPHKVSLVPSSINTAIQRVLALMRHNIREAQIELIDECSPDLPDVLIDASKIDQVFINLILNAISVMKDGGQLTIRTYKQRMSTAGSNVSSDMTELFRIGDTIVIVDILDTGTGIKKRDEAKLFDPFYSTKSTEDGTGLGLSVTRSIVDMHRGMITLENREDTQGACARLLFPTAEQK